MSNSVFKGEEPFVILLAEDNEDDYTLTVAAVRKAGIQNKVIRVKNGEELVDYLMGRGSFDFEFCRPSLIILDINMPKMDGYGVLAKIKSDPCLRGIPVTILTTSGSNEDVFRSYELGANSFIQKPARFKDFVDQLKVFSEYWLNIVKLPT